MRNKVSVGMEALFFLDIIVYLFFFLTSCFIYMKKKEKK